MAIAIVVCSSAPRSPERSWVRCDPKLSACLIPPQTRKGDMLFRAFGRTGETVSVLGVGGSDIGKASSDELSTRIIRTAVDRGVTFMDNS